MTLIFRQLRAVLIFYRSFVIPAMLFNFLGIVIMQIESPANAITQVLFIKILTDLVIAYFLNVLEKGSFYFYYNMGLSRIKLFTLAFIFDIMLLVLMAIIYFSIF